MQCQCSCPSDLTAFEQAFSSSPLFTSLHKFVQRWPVLIFSLPSIPLCSLVATFKAPLLGKLLVSLLVLWPTMLNAYQLWPTRLRMTRCDQQGLGMTRCDQQGLGMTSYDQQGLGMTRHPLALLTIPSLFSNYMESCDKCWPMSCEGK